MTVDNSSQPPYQACLVPSLPEETQHQMRDITNYLVYPLNLVVATMSFACNGLVVYTVARTKFLQQPPLLMLCSLALTDVLFSLYAIYRYIEVLAHRYMCPESVSPEKGGLSALCLLATLGNLAIISRDRYLAVRKPWWYHTHVTKSRAMKLMCVPWLVSLIISFLLYLSKKLPGRFPPLGEITSLLFFLICFFVIIFSYLGIFFKKTPPEEAFHIRAILEREKRTANTVAFILIALLATFLPSILFVLVLNASGVTNVSPFRPFYGFVLQLNGILNPLLNFGRSKEMRRALRNLLKCSQQVQPSSASSGFIATTTTTTTTSSTTTTTIGTICHNDRDNNKHSKKTAGTKTVTATTSYHQQPELDRTATTKTWTAT